MESSNSVEDGEAVDEQKYAALFSAIFGESDTDEDSTNRHFTQDEVERESTEGYLWEKVEDVEGLWHCSNFLSTKQQQDLLEAIRSEGWFCDPLHNQAMRFGDLPGWAKDLSALIQSRSGDQISVECPDLQISDQYLEIDGSDSFRDRTSPFPTWILEREPLFDQMIVNLYQPGEGISAHVDLLRFEDGIAIVSLESTCVMSFRTVNNSSDGVENTHTRGPILGPLRIVNNPSNGVEDTRTREPILDPIRILKNPSNEVEDTHTREPILDRHHDSSPGGGNYVFGPDTKEMSHCRFLLCETSQTIPQAKGYKSHTCERDPSSGAAKKVDVLLNPGDLIITSGPARYNWTHEIDRGKGSQLWQGQPISQQRRVSVTLRRLCSQRDI